MNTLSAFQNPKKAMSFFNTLGAKLKSLGSKPDRPARPASPFEPGSDAVPLPTPAAKPASLETELEPEDTLEIARAAIFHHENDRFLEAFYYESLGASKGDPLCLFLYGMAFREGRGTERNERKGFEYLRKAGEMALSEMKSSTVELVATPTATVATLERRTTERTALRRLAGEHLSHSANELGQCFLQGWGTKADPQMAIYYFELAAELGDLDALIALGDMHMNGQGVKTSKAIAAAYYRLAEDRGAKELPNMQWIWKDKYNDTPEQVAYLKKALARDDVEAKALGLSMEEGLESAGGKKWWH